MKTTYNLICMSFDGDYVTERRGFETVQKAWEHAEDMGSRWFFYPFCFVTTASGLTVVDTPELLEQFKGRRITTVREIFSTLTKLPEMRDADIEEFTLYLHFMEVIG